MRCPKCGYISFDHNLTCPKCNRDISSEQRKLNLPAFMPSPPALLGALTGEASESHVGGMQVSDLTDTVQLEEPVEISPEDSIEIEAPTFGGLVEEEPEEIEIELETDVRDSGVESSLVSEIDTQAKTEAVVDLEETLQDELLDSEVDGLDSLSLEEDIVKKDEASAFVASETELVTEELVEEAGTEEKEIEDIDFELELDDSDLKK